MTRSLAEFHTMAESRPAQVAAAPSVEEQHPVAAHPESMPASAPPSPPTPRKKRSFLAFDLAANEFRFDQRQRYEIDLPEPAVLVVSSTYYPGWRAFVDGTEQPLLRADYALSAVALPAGKHTVELRFSSRPATIGLLLSLLAALGIALLAKTRAPRRDTIKE